MMANGYHWIMDVLQDIEDFCVQNDLGTTAFELEKVRHKAREEIQSRESEQALVASCVNRK